MTTIISTPVIDVSYPAIYGLYDYQIWHVTGRALKLPLDACIIPLHVDPELGLALWPTKNQ